jgi:hypothetical protein
MSATITRDDALPISPGRGIKHLGIPLKTVNGDRAALMGLHVRFTSLVESEATI